MCYRSNRKLIHGKHKFSKTASTQYYAWGKLTPQFPQMVVTFYVWLHFTHKPLTQLQTPNSSHLITSPRPPLAPKPLVIPHIWLLVWRTCFYTHISDAHQPPKKHFETLRSFLIHLLTTKGLELSWVLKIQLKTTNMREDLTCARHYSKSWVWRREQKHNVLAKCQAPRTLHVRAYQES